MMKRIGSKIGVQLLIAFSVVLVLSMFSLAFVAARMVGEFGEYSAFKFERNTGKNARAFMARITHEQAMRYESVFARLAGFSAATAKQAAFVLENKALCAKNPLMPLEKMEIFAENGIFSNDISGKTMSLYWGSAEMSPEIAEEIRALQCLAPFLETVKDANPESVACYVVTEPGIARYYPNNRGVEKLSPAAKFDIRNAAWYVAAKPENNPGRKTVWTNIYLDSVGQGFMITASTPIFGEGEYLGAAGVDVTLDTIVKDLLDNIPSCHKLDGMFSFLVDRQGNLIAFPAEYLELFGLEMERDRLVDASDILKRSLLESSDPEIGKLGARMLEENHHVSEFVIDGRPYVVSSHHLPSTGWRLGVAAPESVLVSSVGEVREALDSTVGKMNGGFALITLLFLICSILAIVVFSIKNFIRPLEKLSEGAMRVREGDLATPVDAGVKNEIADLARAFNKMVDSLRQAREREKSYAENLERTVCERTGQLQVKNEELATTLRKLRQEVSERRKAERELRQSEEKIRNILENSTNLFYSHTADHRIDYVSPQCREFLQCEPEEAMVRWTEFATDNPANRTGYELTEKLIRTGQRQQPYELELKGKKGRKVIVEVREGPVLKDGVTVSVVGSLTDITERKKAGKEKEKLQSQLIQARKMKSIGTLSGGIAHEFNNILGIIIGNNELAMDDIPEWNPAREFLQEVRNAGLRGKELVKQLLSFSRKSSLRKHPLDLAENVKESVEFLKASISSEIAFNLKLDGKCPPVMGSRSQLHQLMANLCGNAAQAMEGKGGSLNIAVKNAVVEKRVVAFDQVLQPGRYVLLTVADTGPGISEEILERVFDPFFTTREVDKGSGMGLAVVYGIIKGHDGFINIESGRKQGTVVSCYFPAGVNAPADIFEKRAG